MVTVAAGLHGRVGKRPTGAAKGQSSKAAWRGEQNWVIDKHDQVERLQQENCLLNEASHSSLAMAGREYCNLQASVSVI